MRPLLTLQVQEAMLASARNGTAELACSLDLARSMTTVVPSAHSWQWQGTDYPYVDNCNARTIYYWSGQAFEPAARFGQSLIKLVPTPWGPPTFEIDGIKMLPTAQVSPWEDAGRKVGLIRPQGKVVLDTCGGLGYFAAWCLELRVERVLSFEKNPDVLWLRSLNPWSPQADTDAGQRLALEQGDVAERIHTIADRSVDAVLHDPPRFGIAGELYSQKFYDQLARVLRRNGMLFHYVGTPNRLTSGRDVPKEVSKRLQTAGFTTRLVGDGVLAIKKTRDKDSR